MRIVVEHLLRAHAYLRTEAPPSPWQPEADDASLIPLLGEMIVAGLSRGNELGELTLSVANVTVPPEAADPMPAGDFVALSIRGRGDWSPEGRWSAVAGAAPVPFWSPDLQAAAERSDAVYGYVRQTEADEGSITVFLPRADDG